MKTQNPIMPRHDIGAQVGINGVVLVRNTQLPRTRLYVREMDSTRFGGISKIPPIPLGFPAGVSK